MFTPRNVVFGFVKVTHPPKPKYLISLYRDDDMEVIACFTTSRARSGVPEAEVQHGCNRRLGKAVSYVFLAGRVIGTDCRTGGDFSFPKQTTIRFDYCFHRGRQDVILSQIENPVVVAVLNDKEYIDLIYAMYQSPETEEKYKPYFEKILKEKLSD